MRGRCDVDEAIAYLYKAKTLAALLSRQLTFITSPRSNKNSKFVVRHSVSKGGTTKGGLRASR